ncbi:glycan biosynthesis hexose transferase WsfD [Cohnella sp. 56]|uniref:glycan biosynthesis hexose transferase WsfD n=1 Tax=Cohnella sp. 56 TaxID=3113722 RepID=UPI0030EB0D2B
MLRSNAIKISVLFVLAAAVIALLIYMPHAIGVADNADFNRTMRAFGLSSISDVKSMSAEFQFAISDPATAAAYFMRIFLPVTDNPAGYYSTQFIFVKIGLFFNALAGAIWHRDPAVFHLHFQTAQYIAIYACALVLFMKEKWRSGRYADIALKAVFAIIFLDCGYLVYFNSFYGEPTTLIFLVLSFVLLLYLEKGKANYGVYAAVILSLFLFSGSKSANFPSAVLLSVPLVYYAVKNEARRKKWIVCASVVVMLGASYGYVKSTPVWMKEVTTFQSVFFGVLYDNPAPEQAVRELGLPPELADSESVNAYTPDPVNPYSGKVPGFRSMFFDHMNKTKVLKYYLTHPSFLAGKLDMSAEAALPLRPTYLSNVQLPDGQEDLRFDFRMNVWESVRKSFSGSASTFLLLVLVLSVANIIALFRRKAGLYGILLRLALLGAAAAQFAIPIVSNGNADLQKHMFLFNVHLDLLIVVLLLDRLEFSSRTFRYAGALSLAILFVIACKPGKPETLTLGRLDGKPIHWYVLEKRDAWVKVISKNVLYRSAYDEQSNDYTQADIQQSLDAKLDQWFTPDERARIEKAPFPALSNELNWKQAESGDRPYYWFSALKYASQDSDRAYRNTYTACLTLPSVDDAERLFRRSKSASVLPADYWLSTPYYNSSDQARIVSSDYQVYHRKVDSVLGVRPVMWIRAE